MEVRCVINAKMGSNWSMEGVSMFQEIVTLEISREFAKVVKMGISWLDIAVLSQICLFLAVIFTWKMESASTAKEATNYTKATVYLRHG